MSKPLFIAAPHIKQLPLYCLYVSREVSAESASRLDGLKRFCTVPSLSLQEELKAVRIGPLAAEIEQGAEPTGNVKERIAPSYR
jgi:hypothetical protein